MWRRRRLPQACGRGAEEWGRIDILVNNAGTTKFAAHTDLAALSAEDWQMIYGVNVIGPFQMMRACVDALKPAATALS